MPTHTPLPVRHLLRRLRKITSRFLLIASVVVVLALLFLCCRSYFVKDRLIVIRTAANENAQLVSYMGQHTAYVESDRGLVAFTISGGRELLDEPPPADFHWMVDWVPTAAADLPATRRLNDVAQQTNASGGLQLELQEWGFALISYEQVQPSRLRDGLAPSGEHSGGRASVYRLVVLPLWLLAALFVVPPAVWGFRLARAHRRRAMNRCIHCGYDLRATSDRCPECGTDVGEQSKQRLSKAIDLGIRRDRKAGRPGN